MGKKAKEIVRLRFKTLRNGEKSAYFDIYVNGVREYLWQEERILPDSAPGAEEHNRVVLEKFEQRRRSLTSELTLDRSGISNRSFYSDLTLLQWLDVYHRELSSRAKYTYMSGFARLKVLLASFNAEIRLRDVNEEFVVSFYEFLKEQRCTNNVEHTFTEGTIWYHMKILGNCLNGAIRDRHIDTNPCRNTLSVIRRRQKKRGLACLSQKELIRLVDTPCHIAYAKRMFLFSCFTGATLETLSKLCWKHIFKKEGRTWAILKSPRSNRDRDITIPLTDMAAACLPHRRRVKGSCPVFEMREKSVLHYHLRKWAERAGITTPLNFIIAKNTYASLLLNADADFYTAGYMMGFSSTRYMEEYEGYLNGKQYDAVDKLNDFLEGTIIETLQSGDS